MQKSCRYWKSRMPLCILVCWAASIDSIGQATRQNGAIQTASEQANAAVSQPAYDVSTFRESKADETRSVYTHFDTLIATGWPVVEMLQQAFGLQRELIVDLPAWTQKARYDVNAKVTEADPTLLDKLTPEQWTGMFRSLCEQRFGLKWHFETRRELVYELVVAKGGSKLQSAAKGSSDVGIMTGDARIVATSEPTSALVKVLSKNLERPVVDRTNLTGLYTFHLQWTPDQVQPSAGALQDSDTAPPLLTALQEQLGLRLQTARDSVQVLVIDSMMPPSEN